MSNRWPDEGEEPLGKLGSIVFGIVGTAFTAGTIGYVLLFTLSAFGLRPPLWLACGIWIALVVAALIWVRPWDRGGAPPSQRRPRPSPPPPTFSGPWG